MPGGDGQGPWWAGGNWMCGRGFGRGYGRGMGRGFGMGFGRGGYWAAQGYGYTPYQQNTPYTPSAPSKEEEKTELKEYVAELEAELEEVKRRLSEIEGKR